MVDCYLERPTHIVVQDPVQWNTQMWFDESPLNNQTKEGHITYILLAARHEEVSVMVWTR